MLQAFTRIKNNYKTTLNQIKVKTFIITQRANQTPYARNGMFRVVAISLYIISRLVEGA